MLTLSLLRHAKSSWDDSSLDDFERPLNKRGEAAAPRMGAFMAQHGLAPDLILCSSAVRARQTLELVLPHLADRPQVVYEDGFYLAAPSAMLARLHKVDAKVRHVLIVGHDPGMQGWPWSWQGTAIPHSCRRSAPSSPRRAWPSSVSRAVCGRRSPPAPAGLSCSQHPSP